MTNSGSRNSATRSVLIAEDEPYIVQSLSFLLQNAGLEIDVAADGAEAMEKLKSGAPDMVLLDLMMEHYTGFDILDFIRSEDRLSSMKVLVLSAKGQDNDQRRAMLLGADRFITKPYANRDVVASVLELLELPPQGMEPNREPNGEQKEAQNGERGDNG